VSFRHELRAARALADELPQHWGEVREVREQCNALEALEADLDRRRAVARGRFMVAVSRARAMLRHLEAARDEVRRERGP
jgi:hypothetical protein